MLYVGTALCIRTRSGSHAGACGKIRGALRDAGALVLEVWYCGNEARWALERAMYESLRPPLNGALPPGDGVTPIWRRPLVHRARLEASEPPPRMTHEEWRALGRTLQAMIPEPRA